MKELDNKDNKFNKTASVFKALCDPNRLTIVEMLLGGEMCACQLLDELNISQSTLSHHMKSLCEAGVVTGRRDGKWMFYAVNHSGCEPAHALLTRMMDTPVQSNSDERCSCD